MYSSVIVLLLYKRKRQCLIAGLIYIGVGSVLWLSKFIYYIYHLASDEFIFSYYCSKGTIAFCFVLNLLQLGLRLAACYFIKRLYSNIILLEDYNNRKEHADFVKSLERNEDKKVNEDKNISEGLTEDQNN